MRALTLGLMLLLSGATLAEEVVTPQPSVAPIPPPPDLPPNLPPNNPTPLSNCAPPKEIAMPQLVRKIRKTRAYTQGLVFKNGKLYESTGLAGKSGLKMIDPNSGKESKLSTLNSADFGEGLAVVGDKFYQLTWQTKNVYVYQLNRKAQVNTKEVRKFDLNEGWGLTEAQGELVASDGSHNLYILDPKTLKTKRTVPVFNGAMPLQFINEMENVNGKILANIYLTPDIFVIEPGTGCVQSKLSLKKLIEQNPHIMSANGATCAESECRVYDFTANGIAYDPKKNELYLTGKNWPEIYVFKNPF